MNEQHALFARHPNTTFIDAHLGWFGSNLAELGRLMDRLPNVYTEIGAVLAELGRQPKLRAVVPDQVSGPRDVWQG